MKELLNQTIKSLKEVIEGFHSDAYPEVIPILKSDSRIAVQKMAESLENKLVILANEQERIQKMKAMEKGYYQSGIKLIGGIDEVGRGPLAGPVVTCVVVLKPDSQILYVNDSKKLSKKTRENLCQQLLNEVLDYEIGIVDSETIDAINILNATKKAMADSVKALATQPDLLLLDAIHIETHIPQKAIIHGDSICYCIGAASIIAKVFRDNMMQLYHEEYPEYGFDHNMGYGTAGHIEAIRKHGLTPIHRRSFVKNMGF
ncbi:MAG: ribonuclease HII [Acetobacterium sp.]